ncbi:unnamed protein product, partial [Ixodes pacificus]
MTILTCAVPYAENPIPPKTFLYVKDAPRKLHIFYCHFPCSRTISNAYMPTRFVAKASGIEDGERELNALMEEIGWRTILEYVKDPNGSNEGLPLEALGHEHKHASQEVHSIKQGSCTFDVRDSQDKWIRMEMLPGDHFVLPSNLYHRFNPSSIK